MITTFILLTIMGLDIKNGTSLTIQFEENKFGQNFELVGRIFIRNIWSPYFHIRKNVLEVCETVVYSIDVAKTCFISKKFRTLTSGLKFAGFRMADPSTGFDDDWPKAVEHSKGSSFGKFCPMEQAVIVFANQDFSPEELRFQTLEVILGLLQMSFQVVISLKRVGLRTSLYPDCFFVETR